MTARYEIVFADPDQTYLQLIATYIRQSRWSERFNVKWFTKLQALTEEWKTSTNKSCLYLVHRDWIPVPKDRNWVMLDPVGRGIGSNEDMIQDHNRLFKYQPIEQLLTGVLQIMERNNQDAANHLEGDTRVDHSQPTVISILSAAGGVGKSTVALNLVCGFNSEAKRSLLVNMEPISSLMPADPEYTRSFGQYLYYSRGGSLKAQEILLKLIRRHPRIPIDILGGSGAFREMEEMTADDIQRLIEHIKEMRVYNTVVVDVDSGVSSIIRGAMTISDRLICLLSEDTTSIRKTAEFLNACPIWLDKDAEFIRAKLFLAYNFWKGESGMDSRPLGVKVVAKLPYIQQWKLSPAWEQAQLDPLFERPMLQLIETLQQGRRGLEHAGTP